MNSPVKKIFKKFRFFKIQNKLKIIKMMRNFKIKKLKILKINQYKIKIIILNQKKNILKLKKVHKNLK